MQEVIDTAEQVTGRSITVVNGQHSLALCQGHADELKDALQVIKARGMGVHDYDHLGKESLQLVNEGMPEHVSPAYQVTHSFVLCGIEMV